MTAASVASRAIWMLNRTAPPIWSGANGFSQLSQVNSWNE
jgi:hypothetical protein